MDTWSVQYYETANGRCPVQEYLDTLEADEAAKVRFDLDLLESHGVELGAPYVRRVRGKLWELRTTARSQHRLLYFAATGKRLVVVHAFTKKTSKTPPSEIDTALRRMADYHERVGL